MIRLFSSVRTTIPFGVIGALMLLSGCSGMPQKQENELPAQYPAESVVRDDITYPIDIYAPWEGFNRGMYRFNAGFDRYVFLPVVGAYAAVMPNVAEDAVSNFFNNIFRNINIRTSI